MKLCTKQGNGVCVGCSRIPPEGRGDICRYVAEDMLDCLTAIIDTEWTYEQEQIFADFEIAKDDIK